MHSELQTAADFVELNLTPEEKAELDQLRAEASKTIDSGPSLEEQLRDALMQTNKNDKPTPLEMAIRFEMQGMNRHQRRVWMSRQSRKVGAERHKLLCQKASK